MFYNKIIGNVLRQERGILDAAPPPAGSFFQRAWYTNLEYYTKTEQTLFIQGMRNNTLDPEDYSHLMVVDIYYCYRAVESLKIAFNRLKPVDPLEIKLSELYSGLIKGYEDYNKYFRDSWYIKQTNGIRPTKNFKEYSDFEQNTAETLHPIYLLAAFIPCYYLWYELGQYLKPSYNNTLYKDWIDGNSDPTPGYDVGNFIEEWIKGGKEWSDDLGIDRYSQAMKHEFTAFNEAVAPVKKTAALG